LYKPPRPASFLFAPSYGESECANRFRYRTVMPMVVTEEAGRLDMEFPSFVDEAFLGMHREHVCDEQVVAAELDDTRYAALDRDRTFRDQRRLYVARPFPGKLHGREFVCVPARFHAAVVDGARKPCGWYVDRKLARVFYKLV